MAKALNKSTEDSGLKKNQSRVFVKENANSPFWPFVMNHGKCFTEFTGSQTNVPITVFSSK